MEYFVFNLLPGLIDSSSEVEEIEMLDGGSIVSPHAGANVSVVKASWEFTTICSLFHVDFTIAVKVTVNERIVIGLE